MQLGRVPDDELAKPRTFSQSTLDAVLAPWYAASEPFDLFRVAEVVLAVAQGTWTERNWVRDPYSVNDFHILARGGLVVTIRLAREYPSYVQLIRIGPLNP